MVCLNCGNEMADNVKFCKYCGAKAELSRPKKRFCAMCGAELNGTAKFCKKCGAETGAAVAAAALAAGVTIPAKGPVTAVTGSDEPPPAATALCCPQCGAPLSANRKFCKKCGAALTASEGAAAVKAERTEQASSAQTKTKRSKRNGQADSAKRPGSRRPMSTGAKRAAETALGQVIAQLTDGDCNASATAGEMSLPVTEAQNAFLKLISKGM